MTTRDEPESFDAARFLADFREQQSIDAELEFVEVCYVCLVYPPALNGRCFQCLNARGLPA
jgi:hypothetical protein